MLAPSGDADWRKRILRREMETIILYGTVAYDYRRNRERIVNRFDVWWLYHLIYEENHDLLEQEESETEITDALRESFAVRKSELSRLRYGQKLYRLWSAWCARCMCSGACQVRDLWPGNPLKDVFPEIRMPEAFALPWEQDPWWGQETGPELAQCIPF